MNTTKKTTYSAALMMLAVGLITIAAPSESQALDGYKDRRGIFTGLGIGGGLGAVNVAQPTNITSTGFDDSWLLGLHLNGIIGGGVKDWLVFGADLNWWIRTVQVGSNASEHHHASANALGQFFFLDSIFIEGGLGLAYTVFQALRDDGSFRYQEMGLATKVGAGFEYF